MTAAIACTPAAPVAITSACRLDVTGGSENTATGYDNTKYPASPEVRYYLTFEKAAAIVSKSYVFAVGSDGKHSFNNYVFPSAGSWTVRLNDASDDSSVQTQAVTVS